MRAALVAAAMLVAVSAHATPGEDLDQARAQFRAGQYDRALPLLNALVYPEPRIASPQDQADVYVALGVCRFETGDTPGAKREFDRALSLNPESHIDPLVVTDQKAFEVFNDTRADVKQRLDAEAANRHRAELRKLRDSIIGVSEHYFAFNFFPFGIGQLQNGQTGKFAAYLAADALTLGASATIWVYLTDKYGIRSTHVPLADASEVRFLQQAEVVSGVAFLVLWGFGAYDAYKNYTPTTKVTIDDSVLPPEFRGADPPKTKKPAKPKSKPTSILEHIVPILTPKGAGIGLGWEN